MKRLLLLGLILLLPLSAFGAIGATAVWECRTTGDDDNGAFYTSGGTDYSQQDAAELTLTDAATSGVGVTTLTSATGGFTSAMVGNGIYLKSGTNATVGYYEITAYTDTNTVTIDRACDDGVGGLASGNIKVGGAAATLGQIDGEAVDGNTIYVKGNRTITSNVDVTSGSTTTQTIIEGYGTTRGDNTQVTITSGAKVRVGGAGDQIWRNIVFDMNGKGLEAMEFTNKDRSLFVNCGFTGSGNTAGINPDKANIFIDCEFYSNDDEGIRANQDTLLINCYFHDNGEAGIYFEGGGNVAFGCISEANTDYGIRFNSGYSRAINCTIDGNGTGVYSNAINNYLWGNIITNHSTGGKFGVETVGERIYMDYNAFYNNDTDVESTDGSTKGANTVTLTGDPYTNRAGHDFSLNNTAGAGEDCRQNSYTGPGNYGTTYFDVGSLGHEETGGGGGASFFTGF